MTTPEGRELFVVEGDITEFEIDAVISNDDVNGRMWATVASSIKLAAGSDIERDSVSRGPYRLCSPWFTYAGNLATKGIIHVAAMDRNGMNGNLDTIKACIRPALDLALDKDMHSVALATIGTGFQKIPLDEWLEVITPEIVNYLRGDKDTAGRGEAVRHEQEGGNLQEEEERRKKEEEGRKKEEERAVKKLAVLLVLYEPDDFGKLLRLLRKVVKSG